MNDITLSNNTNNGNVTAGTTIASGIAFQVGIGSKVTNNTNNGTVKAGSYYAAGIVAMANYDVNITNNTNNGTIISDSYGVAGIVTAVDSVDGLSKISNNVNNGTIQGEYKWIGGILAIANVSENKISLEVSNNINNGAIKTVKGAFRVAGIIGNCNTSTIVFNNINRGNIDGLGNNTAAESYGAGGIVGTKGGNVYIYNCFNTGNVKSKSFAGGIVGNCYPVGEDGNDDVANYDGEYVKGVYNTGIVEATEGYAGGIFGIYDTRDTAVEGISKQITNAYNLGEVKGLNAAGLVGSLIGVKGRLQTYEAKSKSGNDFRALNVVAESITYLS